MSTEILMPALTPTMTHGNLAAWVVDFGESVKMGDVITEIETDKSILEIESPIDGIMGSQKYKSGQEDIAVGLVLAVIYADEAEFEQSKLEQAESEKNSSVQNSEDLVNADEVELNTDPHIIEQRINHQHDSTSNTTENGRIKISPAARRLARSLSIDISQVIGSGPGGRILNNDIELASANRNKNKNKNESVQSPGTATENQHEAGYLKRPLKGIAKTIAERMQESKRAVPHFYLDVDIELDKLVALRKELNSSRLENKVSINDFIVLACAKCLQKFPRMNSQFHQNVVHEFESVDISVAVSIEQGLITPVVKNANNLSLSGISSVTSQLIKKAKSGKLLPEDYQGGTFTVSNLGMYGIKSFKAIVNQPQTAILAVGAGEPRAIIKQGKVVTAMVMTSTLSCDHRVIDGKLGAEFLAELKRYLENPALLSF